MIEIVFPAKDFAAIQSEFAANETEHAAVAYASRVVRDDGTVRLLVREIESPRSADYARKETLHVELRPEFVARITKRAIRSQASIIFLHSHPGSTVPTFSPTDSQGEMHLKAFLDRRHSFFDHFTVIVSAGGVRGRVIGAAEEIRVSSVGSIRQVLSNPESFETSTPLIFDRQVRAFGKAAQHALQQLRIAIVGLGGTGSIVTQQLVHLGVRDFLLLDPDVLDVTNLNRVAGATSDDVGKPKVHIAERYIRAVATDASVRTIQDDVMRSAVARELSNADLIFSCTDSHGSRFVIQQVAYQYLIPCIDLGVTIVALEGHITDVWGRVQLLAPGLPCLTCQRLLDPEEVRRDMLTAFERKADPYIEGDREPAPAVMSLNGTVSSFAVTMLLAIVAGVPSRARHLLYNALTSALRNVSGVPQPDCFICSKHGAFAQGDARPLLARQD